MFMDMNNIWVTNNAFDYGELANTLAHEYGHSTGMDEDAATAYGDECGYGSQYLRASVSRR